MYFQEIVIKYMRINKFEANAFRGPTNLQIIRFRVCQITEMPPLNHVRHSLKILALPGNQIKFIPNGYLTGFSKLFELNLGDNFLTIFPDLHFVAATLKTLLVDNNRIAHLSNSICNTTFTVLYTLHLQHNNLTHFGKDMLNRFPNLYCLRLHGNSLMGLSDVTGIHRTVRVTVRYSFHNSHSHIETKTQGRPFADIFK